MVYTIIINEEQRARISEGLKKFDYPDEETTMLIAMFDELPATEAEDPGTQHGFCL